MTKLVVDQYALLSRFYNAECYLYYGYRKTRDGHQVFNAGYFWAAGSRGFYFLF